MDTDPVVTAEQRRDALADQLFGSVLGALETFHVYLGRTLGLYDVLADGRPRTAGELADAAGIAPRYAREWLEQQACSGVLDLAGEDDAERTGGDGGSGSRRFVMAPGVDAVVRDPDSGSLMAPLASMVVGVAAALPEVVAAFRTGAGVPYEHYGADVRRGIAEANRPGFLHGTARWLDALPDVRVLLARPGARIADLGCGSGTSTLALAAACPQARVDGIDVDHASIAEARERVLTEDRWGEASDRVAFEAADAREDRFAGRYQLVTLFETLHDMSHPVEVLAAARSMLAQGGAVLVGDERVAGRFGAPGDDLERFNYGWSAVHCLPVAMGEEGTAATGTVLRPGQVATYAAGAGFARCTELDVDHDFWRFYRLDP